MKLKNKKTGEIGYPYFQNWKKITCVIVDENAKQIAEYTSLAKLNEEWEDYEEPKEYWYIGDSGEVWGFSHYYLGTEIEENHREIGNLFETKEEAERAVGKLKAWKRLKDKKFSFTEWYKPDGCEPFIVVETNIDYDDVNNKDLQKDLDLLFGGEE